MEVAKKGYLDAVRKLKCWSGRIKLGFVLWDLRRYALSPLRYALLDKIVFPDFLDPINQLPEFVEEGHLVQVVIQ
jgi:hypothetical protein